MSFGAERRSSDFLSEDFSLHKRRFRFDVERAKR